MSIIPSPEEIKCPVGVFCTHCNGWGEDADGRPCPERTDSIATQMDDSSDEVAKLS